MRPSSEVTAALIGAAAALVVACVSGFVWLGALGNRVEQLEQGTWLTEMRTKLRDDVRQHAEAEVKRIAEATVAPSPPVASGPSAEFTDPQSGATVNQRMMARGKSAGLKPDSSLWVFVFSIEASRFFPQAREADVQTNGNWDSLIEIGDAFASGKSFDLLVAEVDFDATVAIKEHVSLPRADGMSSLPRGTRAMNRIAVKRR